MTITLSAEGIGTIEELVDLEKEGYVVYREHIERFRFHFIIEWFTGKQSPSSADDINLCSQVCTVTSGRQAVLRYFRR